MLSGCVRTLALTTQKGDLELSRGGKLSSTSQTGGGEGAVGKGAGSKTENIIILLYKPMARMCPGCSWSPREDGGRRSSVTGAQVGVRGRDRAGVAMGDIGKSCGAGGTTGMR